MTTRKKTMNAVLMPAIGLAMLGGMATLPQVAVATDAADSSVLAAKKAKVHTGQVPGPFQLGAAIGVDVNPTRAKKSYKVVLRVQYKGDWVRCQAKRTQNLNANKVGDFKLKGSKPHEFTWFMPTKPSLPKAKRKACGFKDGKVYKVVVPAQHGLQRGTDTIVWQAE